MTSTDFTDGSLGLVLREKKWVCVVIFSKRHQLFLERQSSIAIVVDRR